MKKRIFSLLIVSLLLLFQPVKAMEYQRFENSEYYVPNAIKNIYDVKLPNVQNPLDWIYNIGGFTLIKGNKIIPTPNLQELAKNQVAKDLPQGYSFVPKENLNLFGKENILLPSPIYYGESPLTFLSTNHILPTNFWDGLWRGIRGLFGASFTNAPNKETLNSVTNLNYDYFSYNRDLVEKLVEPMRLFHENLKSQWSTFVNDFISVEDKEKAEQSIQNLVYKDKNGEDAYREVLKIKESYNQNESYNYKTLKGALYGENGYSGSKEYQKVFNEWQSSIDELLGKSVDEIEQMGGFPDFKSYKYPFNELFGDKENEILTIYQKGKERIAQYNAFIQRFNQTGKDSYSQCLIKSTEDNKCIDNALGQETSYYIGNVHFLSNASKHFDVDGVNTNTVVRYLQTIRSMTGRYYSEVLGNLVESINQHLKKAGKDPINLNNDKIRVIPYDKELLVDKENYSVNDPRNDIYKAHLFGQFISSFATNGFTGGLFYIRLQDTLLNVVGGLSSFNIFLNQFVSFKIYEKWGLSPISQYNLGLAHFAMIVLVLFFFYQTVKNIWKYLTKGESFTKIFTAFVVLFFELGFLLMLGMQPEKTWETIKKPIEMVLYLGDSFSFQNETNFNYLIHDKEDVYKLTYYDAWSKYNVGYGLYDKENYIDLSKPSVETEKLEVPTINGKPIQHWSMLLADSFNYYGESKDLNSIFDKETNKMINGVRLNQNAYRVVDHFLSPRVEVKDENSTKVIKVTQNENLNYQYQRPIAYLIPTILGLLLTNAITILKVFTFANFWFNLYTFIYNAVKEKIQDKLKWSQIFTNLFMPLFYLVLLGTINSVVMMLLMRITNPLVSFLLVIGGFIGLRVGLIVWSKQPAFPRTLMPIVLLIDRKNKQEERQHEQEENDMIRESRQLGISLNREDLYGSLFKEDGTMKYVEPKYQSIYKDYVNTLTQKQKLGIRLSPKEDRAIQLVNGVQKSKDNDGVVKQIKKPKSTKIKGGLDI